MNDPCICKQMILIIKCPCLFNIMNYWNGFEIGLNTLKFCSSVFWRYIDRGSPYNPITKRCNLCNKEKFYIIYRPHMATLNKRHELYTPCKHRLMPLLATVWTVISDIYIICIYLISFPLSIFMFLFFLVKF